MTAGRLVARGEPGRVAAAGSGALRFSRVERRSLAGLYGFIGVLHVAGWGLYLHYSADHPALVGLGLAAYLFGLRHAFDADHIAAIDDTVRVLRQKGVRPLGVGFFFSLGHSTVVVALAVAIVVATSAAAGALPELRRFGAIIGASVSGTFLWVIGILNLLVLLDVLDLWRKAKAGSHTHDHLDELLAKRGLMNRVFGRRLQRVVSRSWQMYPLGLLFGLGFDTASEVSLLAMTAGAAAGSLPLPAAIALPLLFAAGMSAMDTTDGILMVRAWDWAFANPLRKIFYNLTITGLSVAVALAIGTLELLQVAIALLGLHGRVFDRVAALDFGILGYVIVGVFLLAWAASVLVWKLARVEERCSETDPVHVHPHAHAGGVVHSHRHFH